VGGHVFINYRGEDSESYAALLYVELCRRFGSELVFLDSESIPAGSDFVEELLSRVRHARVLLAVIGPRWLTVASAEGTPRILDPADWTRRELAEALAAGVKVIPVLTDGTDIPTGPELPSDIVALCRCQYRRLRRRDASVDLGRLGDELAAADPELAAAAARRVLTHAPAVMPSVPAGGSGDPAATYMSHHEPKGGGYSGRAVRGWHRYASVSHEVLFGVEQIIGRLRAGLRSTSGGWILCVRGAGGVGKTALAYEVARVAEQEGAFDRVLWTTVKGEASLLGIGEMSQPTWGDTVAGLADQLEVPLSASRTLWDRELGDAIRRQDAGTRFLTVVDNLESSGTATSIVDRLVELGFVRPHKLLLTSRWVVPDRWNLVKEQLVRGLAPKDAIALARHEGASDEQLSAAPDSAFSPIVRITEGNPYLIKLIVRRYLSSGLPLERVVQDLIAAAGHLGSQKDSLAHGARDYLFDGSLKELDRRAGSKAAHMLMAAFCVKRRGEEVDYGELKDISGLADAAFDDVLRCGCELELIQASNLNQRYSIHSLLYEFTVGPMEWLP